MPNRVVKVLAQSRVERRELRVTSVGRESSRETTPGVVCVRPGKTVEGTEGVRLSKQRRWTAVERTRGSEVLGRLQWNRHLER